MHNKRNCWTNKPNSITQRHYTKNWIYFPPFFEKNSECRNAAIDYAIEIGWIGENCEVNLACEYRSTGHTPKNLDVIGQDSGVNAAAEGIFLKSMARIRAVARAATLKNYANKFEDIEEISETSSYLEIYNCGNKRMIVKKIIINMAFT